MQKIYVGRPQRPRQKEMLPMIRNAGLKDIRRVLGSKYYNSKDLSESQENRVNQPIVKSKKKRQGHSLFYPVRRQLILSRKENC